MGIFHRLEKKDPGKTLKEITVAIRAGDERTFKRYFEYRFARLYNYALSLDSDPVVAEDLVQNAFLKLWQNREKLSEDKSIDSLMMTTVRNELFDIKRSHYESRRGQMDEVRDVPISEHNLDYKDQLEHYLRLIRTLPGKRREVFTLSRIQGVPNAEIAEKLGISIRTVEKHINLALRFLRENGYQE